MPERKKIFTIATALSAFENLLSRRSAHTVRAYRTDLESFKAWKRAESVEHALYDLLCYGRVEARLVVETFENYSLHVQKLARNTVNRRISALKSFVSQAFVEGLVDWNLEVETTRALSRADKKGFKKWNTEGQTAAKFEKLVGSLLRASKKPASRLAAIRDLAIIHLLKNPMLRRSEVSALNVADIDLTIGAEKVYLGKARSEIEALPIPPDGIAAISTWLKVRGGTRADPLFVSVLKAGVCTNRRLRTLEYTTLQPNSGENCSGRILGPLIPARSGKQESRRSPAMFQKTECPLRTAC